MPLTSDPYDPECQPEDPLEAKFVGTPTDGPAPLEVQFVSTSTGEVTETQWDFGDGETSVQENPVHAYKTPGIYSVSLTVYGPDGSDSISKPSYVNVSSPPLTADFSASPTKGNSPLTVQFADSSTGTVSGWSWDFGDGETGSDQHPARIYSTAGTYTVSLTVSGNGDSNTRVKPAYVVVAENAPEADFSAAPTTGTAPLSVDFSDASTGTITQRSWNFGDGETSPDEDPAHSYLAPGSYTVSLTVDGPGGTSTETKDSYIVVEPEPVSTYAISGRILGDDTAGIVVNLSGDQTMTAIADSGGAYIFPGLSSGTYTVTPFSRGIQFEPASSSHTISVFDVTGVDFTLKRQSLSIRSAYAVPNQVAADGETPALLLVQVFHPAGNENISSVAVDLSAIGGGVQEMSDDGALGDEVPGDGLYSLYTAVQSETPPGWKVLPISASDIYGAGDGAAVTLEVSRKVTDTADGFSIRNYTVDNDIRGQTLVVQYSLESVSIGRSYRTLRQSETDTEGDVLLQIFKPDGTSYLGEEVPVTDDVSEIAIEDAEQGTWTYQVTNNRPEAQNYSISTTSSGTSVVTGVVIDAETGEAIDGATISTDGGGSTRSDEGYYVLLHPSGVFSIRAMEAGHQSISKSVVLGAGESAVVDLIMEKTSDDPQPACALSALFSREERHYFGQLRTFRDRILSTTAMGRHYIDLYYRFSPELISLFQKDCALKQDLRTCVVSIQALFRGVADGKPLLPESALIKDLRYCFTRIKGGASRELQKEIDALLCSSFFLLK